MGRARPMRFVDDLVDRPAQGLAVEVGAGARIGPADDFERRDAGGGRERVGVERALMRDLLAVGGFRDLEDEQVEDVLAACYRAARQPAREGFPHYRPTWPDAIVD